MEDSHFRYDFKQPFVVFGIFFGACNAFLSEIDQSRALVLVEREIGLLIARAGHRGARPAAMFYSCAAPLSRIMSSTSALSKSLRV